MVRRCLRWSAVVMGVVLAASVAVAQGIEATSKIDSVTLYRDQALVVRSVRADVPAGVSEVVVPDLPQQVVADSLFASGDKGAQIRAVRLRTRAVKEEPREEIRQLDEQIQELQDSLRRNEAMRGLVGERKRYLDKLEQFTAPTAQVELSKGVLNAKTLESLTLFLFEQRGTLVEELLKLELEKRELTKQVSLLQRKKSELAAGSTRTVREAVLFVDRAQAGEAELSLSYLVKKAGWEPTYNLRAGEGQATVAVEYNATVYQMSGEDWQDVELVLSTASPALVAKGPDLAPFWVLLAQAPQVQARRLVKKQAQTFQQELYGANVYQQRATEEQVDANWRMNTAAWNLQKMEVDNPEEALARLRLWEPTVAEGLSVTYPLAGRTSLASRSDRQMVQIASLKLKSQFYYVGTPLLTRYVYREAEIANDSQLALLEGPATCYLDGRFVGRGRVPLVARGQRFRSGFGMNSQLRASRELVEKKEDIVGGNRQQSYDYRLVLENFSEDVAQLQLYDRIPTGMEAADIRVTLGEMSDKLSDDALYLEREHPRGILRWDVEVAARSAGPEARKVEYRYTLEFDRKLTVVTPAETGKSRQAREQFEELMRSRELSY